MLPGGWALKWQPCLWREILGAEKRHWSGWEAYPQMPNKLLMQREVSVSAHTMWQTSIWLWTSEASTLHALFPCQILHLHLIIYHQWNENKKQNKKTNSITIWSIILCADFVIFFNKRCELEWVLMNLYQWSLIN